MSIPASAADILWAKTLLRANGYVVIQKERHVVFTVDRALSLLDYEHMRIDEEGWKRFNEHMDGNAAHQIGVELLNQGFITKDDIGWDASRTRHGTRYQRAAIKPREPKGRD